MRLIDRLQIASGFVPVDLQAAANAGDYISMKNIERLLVVFFKAAGTAGDDPVISLQQATDVAGTAVKDLTFTRIYKKQGAALTAVGQFTEVVQTAAASYTDATSAEIQAIYAIEIKADDLDVDNGFDCVRASIADVGGNAQLGCMIYIADGFRYVEQPLPSIIA